ncbi:MAG TPA: glucose-1-phosphate adenylyltransferase [Nitrospirae bacterium]|nr:glucose-1-phosphate adenylyltransferase [Nitrospirota bacterium]
MYASIYIAKNTLAMIMAGGKGERLQPITANKPKPAVPFGGKYKIIDFVLSNVFNSGIRKIYVLTQYQAYSLNKHIKASWSKWTGLNEFFDTLSPETRTTGEQWYLGTADAIYQNIQLLESSSAELIAIFGGDHIYKMDISQMLIYHKMNKADITIASIEVSKEEAKRFGILSVDEDFKVKTFVEKPQTPPNIPGRDTCFASMGNYIFSKKVLIEMLKEGKKYYYDLDFGKHIIPMMIEQDKRVFAYNFFDNTVPSMTPQERGYWMDVGTIDSYYEANMDLISVNPRLNLYNYDWPILTNQGNLPPAKTVFDNESRRGVNLDSLVCGGCITSGGTVRRSILGPSSRINSYCLIEDSIVFENVEIGRHCKIKRTIIDDYVIIPEGTVIGYDLQEDKKRGFTVTDSGIVVVTRENFR